MYAGAELSWIGGVEAKRHCATDNDCIGNMCTATI